MGLGKNNDGIKEPLKAHKKSDKLGLGSNENEENHKHWWDLVYNKTVGNINVAEKVNIFFLLSIFFAYTFKEKVIVLRKCEFSSEEKTTLF